MYKDKCYEVMDSINRGLSPYHWEVEETYEDVRDRKTQCYLIGLFTGENKILEKVKEM